ncbi:hypothetical protein PoB_001006800 [Plakobranchus ocellatus]|uniref:Uncharacterized protein n=1 Tax=Plakobranchus ocellatus TaxID=259542 RepID=A0AAV3YMI2_9GAST|nr:hypothetical protein PoB_001006800 [Plakobranchus ocellatus]
MSEGDKVIDTQPGSKKEEPKPSTSKQPKKHVPGVPPGLESLCDTDQLVIKKTRSVLPGCCIGPIQANYYYQNQPVFSVEAPTDECLSLMACSKNRSFVFSFMDTNSEVSTWVPTRLLYWISAPVFTVTGASVAQ